MKERNPKDLNAPSSGEPISGAAKASRRRVMQGMYTAAVSAIVLAIAVVFNLILGALPAGTLELDISGRDIYAVTQKSVDFLKGLDKDVSIVVLAQGDAVDERLLKFINNYAKASPRVRLEIIDPVLDPTALTKYGAKENNVVVSCEATGKKKILNLAGFEGYDDALILYDASTYYYSNKLQPVALDAEGLLTGAVSYVTNEKSNKMYLLKGHGEAQLGQNASSLLSKANIETATLNLLVEGKVPDDCELIFCYNPAQDLSDDELDLLEAYLRSGGNVMLMLDNPGLKNFGKLLSLYGLQMKDGYLGDSERYYKMYVQQYGIFCIYPELSKTSDITSSITSDAILRFARGMEQITPERRNAVVTPFLTTSDKGVLAVDEKTSVEGKYVIGATSVEIFEGKEDNESRLTVISAVDLISDDISRHANLSNYDIFLSAVNKNFSQTDAGLAIPEKSLTVTTNTIAHPGVWSAVFVGVIPISLLAGGLVYWIRRRNR